MIIISTIATPFGCWLAGFSSFAHHGDAFAAEAMALRDGLLLAWDHGYKQVSCDVDCEDFTLLVSLTKLTRTVSVSTHRY